MKNEYDDNSIFFVELLRGWYETIYEVINRMFGKFLELLVVMIRFVLFVFVFLMFIIVFVYSRYLRNI